MKKLGAKEICGTIVVAGVALCLVIYFLVFNKYNDLTDSLKSSNKALQQEVNDLKVYYDNMATYQAGIAQMKETIAEVTADYPGDALEEDVIMMAVNMQENTIVNFDKINIDSQKVIHSIPADLVKGLNDETLQTQIDFKERAASYSCTTDYFGLKSLIQTVYDDNYRVGINAVSFANDKEETNFIKGTIDISYYSLDGMNKEYNKPELMEYAAGAFDLFPATVVDGETVVITGEGTEE